MHETTIGDTTVSINLKEVTNEYVVAVIRKGRLVEAECYYTDDLADAEATFDDMVRRYSLAAQARPLDTAALTLLIREFEAVMLIKATCQDESVLEWLTFRRDFLKAQIAKTIL